MQSLKQKEELINTFERIERDVKEREQAMISNEVRKYEALFRNELAKHDEEINKYKLTVSQLNSEITELRGLSEKLSQSDKEKSGRISHLNETIRMLEQRPMVNDTDYELLGLKNDKLTSELAEVKAFITNQVNVFNEKMYERDGYISHVQQEMAKLTELNKNSQEKLAAELAEARQMLDRERVVVEERTAELAEVRRVLEKERVVLEEKTAELTGSNKQKFKLMAQLKQAQKQLAKMAENDQGNLKFYLI
jgi:hypothetical protein